MALVLFVSSLPALVVCRKFNQVDSIELSSLDRANSEGIWILAGPGITQDRKVDTISASVPRRLVYKISSTLFFSEYMNTDIEIQ